MPQDAGFILPFPVRTNRGAAGARARHLDWVAAHGLVPEGRALRRYRDWRLTDLVAHAYPDAGPEDLDLVTDAVCLGFPLDDHFDGPLGREPERVARLAGELSAIPYRPPGTPPAIDLPLTRAYTEVWRRSAAGMSARWRQRAAGNLTRFFRSYVREAHNRRRGSRLDEETYVALRRQAVGTAPCFDLIERAGHIEVPPDAYGSPELRTLIRCAGDVIFLCNDMHSVEREEAQGDPHNLLLIRQRTRGCSRAEAIAQVTGLVRDRAALFQSVAARLPDRYAAWRLDARGVVAVERYTAGLRDWMAANQHWGVVSARYASPVTASAAGPAAGSVPVAAALGGGSRERAVAPPRR
jgi:hypothetical protein